MALIKRALAAVARTWRRFNRSIEMTDEEKDWFAGW